MTDIAVRKLPSDFVTEYLKKSEAGQSAIETFEAAQMAVREAALVQGTGTHDRPLDVGHVTAREFADSLLKSAWRHIYSYLQIDKVATATDKKRLDTFFVNPPEFTVENIREHLGDYLIDQRGHLLRGLAECFVKLDPAYKSHSKVRIGVKGLPKRVILQGLLGYRGRDTLGDILNAISRLDGSDEISYGDLYDLLQTAEREGVVMIRDMKLKAFANGNCHLFFGPDSLRTINGGLAEYYGEVLPDAPEESATRRASTDVSTDLAFYPTPAKVVETVMSYVDIRDTDYVLEPSCGDGAFLDHLPRGRTLGVEVDARRAEQCRAKGHDVILRNFLEMEVYRKFNKIIMNPPFCGRHYLKHIEKAIECLEDGGTIVAILPATAWYDHGELPTSGHCSWDAWRDLPVGSFASSGTNVPTGIWTYHKKGLK